MLQRLTLRRQPSSRMRLTIQSRTHDANIHHPAIVGATGSSEVLCEKAAPCSILRETFPGQILVSRLREHETLICEFDSSRVRFPKRNEDK